MEIDGATVGERRRDRRIETRLPVRVRFRTRQEVHEGVCLNLSAGGMFVRLQELPPPDEEVLVEFSLEPGPLAIVAEAEVAWALPEVEDAAGEAGFGLRFTSLDDAEKVHVRRAISRGLVTPP